MNEFLLAKFCYSKTMGRLVCNTISQVTSAQVENIQTDKKISTFFLWKVGSSSSITPLSVPMCVRVCVHECIPRCAKGVSQNKNFFCLIVFPAKLSIGVLKQLNFEREFFSVVSKWTHEHMIDLQYVLVKMTIFRADDVTHNLLESCSTSWELDFR